MNDVLFQPAQKLVADMANGALSAVELMQATLARVELVNRQVNAIVAQRDPDDLLQEAEKADAVPAGERGALHGLPMAVKDLTDVRGLPTRWGSKAYPSTPVSADGLMVSRMRKAGAIFMGKTNVPELGLGSHSFNDVYGTTLNPYDAKVSAGGSSGGAGVALATGMQVIADGSDMMGSLRNPAAWNNVYGFRPTVGTVPSEPSGDVFLHKLSTLGPMARNVQDIALLLDVQSGPDPRFPHLRPKPDVAGLSPASMKGLKIGWLGDWGGALPFEAGILDQCELALKTLSDLGAEVELVAPPFAPEALWDNWTDLRSFAIAADYGAVFDAPGNRPYFKDSAVWEIMRGRALSATDIQKASEIRSDWFRKAAALFEEYDALVMPSAQVWPFPQEIPYPTEIAGRLLDTYHRWMEVVIPVSLIGCPSLSVPIGFGANGLPMGMQIACGFGQDRKVLEIGEAWHRATDWPNARPALMR